MLKILYIHQSPLLKFDPLIYVHRHALSPVHFLHHVLRSFVFLFSFHYAYLISNCCFSITWQKVINGVGWPDDRHGLSPILSDTAPLLVYTDQLLCHCILICSNVRKWLVYCMRWLLWCFCLLAESYETINHYHYHFCFPISLSQ